MKTNFSPIPREEEIIGKAIVNAAYQVHKELGPGLLEKVYEVCFCHVLSSKGFQVRRQINIPIVFDNIIFDEGLRLDVLVNDSVICELKALETLNPVWEAQILSHLRLTNKRLGYLINFNVPLIKDGIKRFVM
jgi:GxxExxY protein